MKWLPAALLLIGAFFMRDTAQAHHLGPFFPIDRSLFTMERQLEKTDYWPWTYEQRCSGNIYADIAGTMQDKDAHYGTISPEGNFNGLISQNHISTCSIDLIASCGSGAVACVGSDAPFYPRNCDAKYDGVYMATFYSFASRKSVPKHEIAHCDTGRAEDYDDDQNDGTPGLICIPSPSIMGCGPNHPLDYSTYDDQMFAIRHYPAPKVYAYPFPDSPGYIGIYWSPEQSEYPLTSRIAIVYWNCITGETGWLRTVDASLRFTSVQYLPNVYYYVIAQNALMSSLSGENGATIVGGMHCP